MCICKLVEHSRHQKMGVNQRNHVDGDGLRFFFFQP